MFLVKEVSDMKLFVDTGNLDEIRKAAESGVLDGVTTNPSLIAKEGRDFEQTIREIGKIITAHNPKAVVNAEVVSVDAPGMVAEANKLVKLHKNVVVKIPLIPEGIKAVKQLSSRGIRTNVTLCFSPNQALLAAKAGATFVSPFVGRLNDIGQFGMQNIGHIKDMFKTYGYKTEVLVASVRSPIDVTEAALSGADICTVPYAVFEKLFQHPLTDSGLKKFLEDWQSFKKPKK